MTATNSQAQSLDETPIEDWPSRFEIIPITKLFVDKAYQRRVTNLAKEIAEKPIKPLLTTICVSARKETGSGVNRRVTSGAVFDGQTRLEGVKGWNAKRSTQKIDDLACVVFSGLSQAQEAQLFEWIQTKRRNATSYDTFRSSLVAGNEESLAIRDLVDSTGYEVGYAGMSDRTIAAVRTVQEMYRMDIILLERALIIYREAWRSKWIPSGYQLKGMFTFLRKHPDCDDERLVRRMSIQGPADLEKKAQNARELKGTGRSVIDMVSAIESVYAMREGQVAKKAAQVTA